MRYALIIPTYGFITYKDTAGQKGTRARVAKAAELIRQGVVARNCIVPFSQKQFPKGEDLKLVGKMTLGENVADYVRWQPEFSNAEVIDTSLTAGTIGTFNDTVAALKLLYFEMEKSEYPEEVLRIHFVSDWSQLGRLWLIWHLAWKRHVKRRYWCASFHLVPNFRTVPDVWLHEPPAYLKCLWNCIWFKWRPAKA